MSMIKRDTFAPSRRPLYLQLPLTRTPQGAVTRAVWYGRKKGRTTVTIGVQKFWEPGGDNLTDQQLIDSPENTLTRAWEYQWDGLNFLANPTAKALPSYLALIQGQLEHLLTSQGPDAPGWVGPYYTEAS